MRTAPGALSSPSPERLRQAEATAEQIRADLKTRIDTRGDRFNIEIEGQEYLERGDAAPRLRRLLIEATHTSPVRHVIAIGRFAGFALEATVQRGFPAELILRGKHEHATRVHLEESSAAGNLQTLEALPRQMEATLENVERNVTHFRQQLLELQALSQATWEHQVELDRLLARQRELDSLLGEQPEDRRMDLAGLDVAADSEDVEEAA